MQISKSKANDSGVRHPLELSPHTQAMYMRSLFGQQDQPANEFPAWPSEPILITPPDFGLLRAQRQPRRAPSPLTLNTHSDDELASVTEDGTRADSEDEDGTTATKRKARFHFTHDADITMFREIMGEDGLFVEDGCTAAQRWQRVYTTLNLDGIDCTLQSMKNRVANKVAKYKAAQAKSKRKSGTDEPPEPEIDQLVREYIESTNEQALSKAARRKSKDDKDADDARRGRQIRDAATERMVTTDSTNGKKRAAAPQALREYVDLQKIQIEYKKHGYAILSSSTQNASKLGTRQP